MVLEGGRHIIERRFLRFASGAEGGLEVMVREGQVLH